MTTGNTGPFSGSPEPRSLVSGLASHAPGSLFAGKYVIEKVMGQGGMGVVLAARHSHLQERVAIKCLLPQFSENRDVVARFVQEARAARRIRSEHVVRIDDVDTLDSGTPYIVMECLEGQDLEQLVAGSGALSVVATIDFVTQALEALAEAHALGIVHRDLKPANLFLTHRTDGSPCIKVLDFGISKVASAARSTESGMTKTSAMLGSPHYMSPEQIRSSRDVDARSDIWAIGVIVHELLTGALPFESETIPDLFVRILTESPRPLTQVRGDIPVALERTVQRCLEKDLTRRFANVAELATALAESGSTASRTSAERISRVLQGHLATALAVPAVASMVGAPTSPNATPYPSYPGSHPAPGATPYGGAPTSPNATPYHAPTQLGEPARAPTAVQTGFSASRTNSDAVAIPKRNVPALAAGGVAVVAILALVGVLAYSAGSRHGEDSGTSAAVAPGVAGATGVAASGPAGTAGASATTVPSTGTAAGEATVPPLDPVVPAKTGTSGLAAQTAQASTAAQAAATAPKAHPTAAASTTAPAATTTRSMATATAAATTQQPAYPGYNSSAAAANTPLPPPPAPRSQPPAEEEDRPSQFHQFFNGIGQGFRRSVHRASQ
ncbi:MAG TPA: protein kinase [Polyangiaceae bacterium]|jgi:serine/threonine-protein kinase|nr:protein kinase [Polyangiaceae bacterium]